MVDAKLRVLFIAPTFQSNFQSTLLGCARKWFTAVELVTRSVTDDPNEQRRYLDEELKHTTPTAVISISVRPDAETIAKYQDAGIPFILVDEEAPGTSMVTSDNIKGGNIAGTYLLKKGRKKIAVVSGRTEARGGYNARNRVTGLRTVLQESGLAIPTGAAIEVSRYSREDGLEAMPRLLKLDIDAIFCAAGDMCATGLLSVARERRVKVPADVAIIGYDDMLIAQMSSPPLTTIRQPLQKMADAACDMARRNPKALLTTPRRVVLEPELVIRQSA